MTIAAALDVRMEASTKARVLIAVHSGHRDVPTLARECALPHTGVIFALQALKNRGLVQYHGATNADGIKDIRLTKQGEAAIKGMTDMVDEAEVVSDLLAGMRGKPRLQTTLSPVAPRATLETSVIKVAGRPGRTVQATDPHAHGNTAEGGPVTVTHAAPAPSEAPAPPAEVSGDRPDPQPVAQANVEALLDGLPLITALRARGSKRDAAMEAAGKLMDAGMDDLAGQVLDAVPTDSDLETEVIRLLSRIGG